jgi:thiosulfate dehydrogenase [quinone] large subunit
MSNLTIDLDATDVHAPPRPQPPARPPNGIGLAVLRIVVGITWLHEAQWKTPPEFSGLSFWLNQPLEHPTFGPWNTLIETVILPNLTLFGWVTLLTEASLGAFLIVGLGTRLWAAVGVLQASAITLSVISVPDEWSYAYYLLVAAHVALLFGAGGRSLGIDGVLRERWKQIGAAGQGIGARLGRLMWWMS